MHKMILKQRTQHSPKDYAPDRAISKKTVPGMYELLEPLENAIRDQ